MRGKKVANNPKKLQYFKQQTKTKKMSVYDTKSKFTRKNGQLLRKHSSIY